MLFVYHRFGYDTVSFGWYSSEGGQLDALVSRGKQADDNRGQNNQKQKKRKRKRAETTSFRQVVADVSCCCLPNVQT